MVNHIYVRIYLEGGQYDQALAAFGVTPVNNEIWLTNKPEDFINRLLDMLDLIDRLGYCLETR